MKKKLIIGAFALTSLITLAQESNTTNTDIQPQGRFAGTGWKTDYGQCYEGFRTVTKTYTILWVIQVGETTVSWEPC